MTKDEIKGLMNTISASYPHFYHNMDNDQKQAMLIVWYDMLHNDNPAVVKQVVRKHIATSKYPPSIAEIRAGIRETTMPTIAQLYKIIVRLGKQSLKTESVLIARGKAGQADTYQTRSLKQDAFKDLPDELKVYVKDADGLQDWVREWNLDEEKTRKKFKSDMQDILQDIDLMKIEQGFANPYMLEVAR